MDHVTHNLQVIPLLSHLDERIVNEVLALLQALLESGNITVQEGFVNFIEASPDNPIFPKLQDMLRRAAILHKERCALEAHYCITLKFQAQGIGEVVVYK